jgi:uncharacterized protein (TIGR04141 family)
MAEAEEETRFSVSVYLVNTSHAAAVEAELFSSDGSSLPLKNEIEGGRFLALPAEPNTPRWVAYIEELLPANGSPIAVVGQAPGGLLWIPRNGKQFIFSFGYAHSLLKEEWLEPEFGKKVALSVIPQGQVVELRAEQVFARRHVASERAPRAASVREFGFEADRDLVAAVEGVPSPAYIDPLGKKVRGGTALRFGIRFSAFLETLDVIAERFDSGAYKKIWPQMDYLAPVRDAARTASLDDKLDGILGKPKPEDHVSLAAPAIRTGDRPYPEHFAIGRLTKKVVTVTCPPI